MNKIKNGIIIDGVTYEAVEDLYCENCAFHLPCLHSMNYRHRLCTFFWQTLKSQIIFKKMEDEKDNV